ncbi:MAG: tetratricopeptide repeat protein [Bacteroidetes bacterium]|nr:MAG: tetratricopeptide repeat protein [Bacteroidota bacterium]
MRKYILISAILACTLCSSVSLAAQADPVQDFGAESKGVTPTSVAPPAARRTVRAVVVGISDYQEEAIPDLNYAHSDAEAFARFLRSEAGGGLPQDNVRLLINKDATAGNVALALFWLLDESREGDLACIYFSGHGDVERKIADQPGYLLCWDAPSHVYMAGGTIDLTILQAIIKTLSEENKARVLLITDACRSGKLAGSEINGTGATTANLQQFNKAIKILSCQPNEYSLEGRQWGGGRGAFSYHLIDGLCGLADANQDHQVSLSEIGRYLEDRVSAEVAPYRQIPIVDGDRSTILAHVVPEQLEQLRSGKKQQLELFTPTESKSLETEVLATLDSNTQAVYQAFKQALKDKQFLAPEGKCADSYFEQLINEPKLERLHATLRRNYAAALQDDAQQVLNTILKSGLTEEWLAASKASHTYRSYPAYLDRAAELLGKDHYMYPILQARKYFFECRIAQDARSKRKAFNQSLHWQPDMPFAYVEMVSIFGPQQADSAEYYTAKALEQVPNWTIPYIQLGLFYTMRVQDYNKAHAALDKAAAIDSNAVFLWLARSTIFLRQKRFEEAEQLLLKIIEQVDTNICFPCMHQNLGQAYLQMHRYPEAAAQYQKAIALDSTFSRAYNGLGKVYQLQKRYAEAERWFKKSIELDSTFSNTYFRLGYLYSEQNRDTEAERYFLKSIQLKPRQYFAHYGLGNLYMDQNRYEEAAKHFNIALAFRPSDMHTNYLLAQAYQRTGRYPEAEKQYLKTIALDPGQPAPYYDLACMYSLLKKHDPGFEYLDNALRHGYQDYKWLQQDKDLEYLRSDPERWKALMDTYFPD